MANFGFSNFQDLLPGGGSSSGWEANPDFTPATSPQKDAVSIIAEEIAVLGEIIRQVLPISRDENGAPRFATKGEFNDIKDNVRQQLFAPKPPNVVTQDDFLGALSHLTQQIAAISEKVDSLAAPAEPEKPRARRKPQEVPADATEA